MRTGRTATAPGLVLLVTLVVGATAAGCDSRPPSSLPGGSTNHPAATGALLNTPIPSPTLGPGWSLHSDTVEGYAIGFPDTWNFVFRDSPTFDADIRAISATASDIGGYFSAGFARAQAGGVRLIAAEPRSVDSGFVTNLSVFKTDLGPPQAAPDVDAVSASKRAVVAKDPALQGDVKHERVDLPSGAAELISYTLKPGDSTVAVRTYLLTADFPGRRVLYEVLMGTNVKDYAGFFERTAGSFRLLPSAPGPGPSTAPSPSR